LFTSEIKKLIHKILKFLSDNIQTTLRKEIKYKDNNIIINFDENIFLEPYKLKELLITYSKYNIKNMIRKMNNCDDNNKK
jgi:hypothetical protein